MPDTPKHQQIIDAIVTRLGDEIIGSGDYATALAVNSSDVPNVRDSQPNWDQEQGELPAISIFEGRTEAAEAPNGRRRVIHTMPVMIKGFLERGTSAADARAFIADIKRAILGNGTQSNNWLAERWPNDDNIGIAMETREVAHAIDYAEDTYEVTGVQVEINVIFITDKLSGN